MLETVRKAMLTGLGALDLTEEKLEAFLKDLTRRGEMTEREAREFGSEWRTRVAERREQLQRDAREALDRAFRGLNVATHQDLEALAKRVDALERGQPGSPQREDLEC